MSFRGLLTDLLGGGIPIQRSVVTLTDAQIKALPSSAITLVAAPGSGNRVKPIAVTLSLTASAGAYTNLNPTSGYLVVSATGFWLSVAIANDDSLSTNLEALNDFLGQAHAKVVDMQIPYVNAIDGGSTSGDFAWVQHAQGSGLPTAADLNNATLVLEGGNGGSGNWTGGNAANTLKVTTYYCVEAL